MISYNFVFCILCVGFLINICVFPTLGSARPLFIEWATQADLVFTLLTLDPVLLHPPACTLFAEMCVLFHTILYMHLFLLCCHALEVSCFCVVFLRSRKFCGFAFSWIGTFYLSVLLLLSSVKFGDVHYVDYFLLFSVFVHIFALFFRLMQNTLNSHG